MLSLQNWLPRRWDSWASVSIPVPYPMFGRGSRRPFSWYFDGLSQVTVQHVSDIERWLVGCEYVPDRTLFGKEDHWQHPGEFEVIRMGDCDDHALWAWRKFVDLEIPTSLVAGRWREEPADLHLWLLVTIGGRDHIFESTSKFMGRGMKPLREVRDDYRPFFSVDGRFRTRAYAGGLQELIP